MNMRQYEHFDILFSIGNGQSYKDYLDNVMNLTAVVWHKDYLVVDGDLVTGADDGRVDLLSVF